MSFSADCTRPVESHEKPHPNCFAVGPLVDDGAIRTYYVSCRELNNEEMCNRIMLQPTGDAFHMCIVATLS